MSFAPPGCKAPMLTTPPRSPRRRCRPAAAPRRRRAAPAAPRPPGPRTCGWRAARSTQLQQCSSMHAFPGTAACFECQPCTPCGCRLDAFYTLLTQRPRHVPSGASRRASAAPECPQSQGRQLRLSRPPATRRQQRAAVPTARRRCGRHCCSALPLAMLPAPAARQQNDKRCE